MNWKELSPFTKVCYPWSLLKIYESGATMYELRKEGCLVQTSEDEQELMDAAEEMECRG